MSPLKTTVWEATANEDRRHLDGAGRWSDCYSTHPFRISNSINVKTVVLGSS